MARMTLACAGFGMAAATPTLLALPPRQCAHSRTLLWVLLPPPPLLWWVVLAAKL
jgi:hypothetical protein